MDWIDPRHKVATQEDERKLGTKGKKGKRVASPRRAKLLSNQVSAAMSQPLDVWASAYDHAISRLKWPNGVSVENTFLFSAVMQEQAEVLVRAGMSAKKLSEIVSENPDGSDAAKAARIAEVVGLMEQSLESTAFGWLATADAYAKSALGVAALAWHLPEQAQRPGNEWLTQWLQSVVERSATYTPDLDESVVCHLILHCELPLLIGLATSVSHRTVLGEATRAMDNLAEYLERSEDTPAPWLAHGTTYLRTALASVARCRVLANSLGLRKWYPPQQRALANLLKHAARWSRSDGTQLLAASRKSPRSKSIWESLLKQTKAPKSLVTVMQLSGLIASHRGGEATGSVRKMPALTHYCEDAAGVCMQGDWHKRGNRFALDFSDSEICIEVLGPKGQPILAGEWKAGVELDQQAQLQLDEWSEVCWFTDDDVDYLELEAKFGQHARVQRQALFFREDRLLLLADALLCDQPGDWSFSSRLPLARDVKFEPAQKTNECFLVSPAGRSLAVPLSLPEWRREIAVGGFAVEDDVLIAHNQTHSQRLYTATLISLCNSHAKKPFTWRRLTVGEDLRIVGADEAVAFRMQIGGAQWLIYRSLVQTKRRTSLGMHTLSEFFVGRFDGSDGEVDTLLTVEASS